MKVASYDIVFQEVPGEVTLALNISGCPCHCKGCHSPHLWEDTGEPLTTDLLDDLIARYAGLITCVAFMGGDQDPAEVLRLAEYVKSSSFFSSSSSSSPSLEGRAGERFSSSPSLEGRSGERSSHDKRTGEGVLHTAWYSGRQLLPGALLASKTPDLTDKNTLTTHPDHTSVAKDSNHTSVAKDSNHTSVVKDSNLTSEVNLKSQNFNGENCLNGIILSCPLDYIKLGPYIESLGGLKSERTNQRFYKRVGEGTPDSPFVWKDITSVFLRHI